MKLLKLVMQFYLSISKLHKVWAIDIVSIYTPTSFPKAVQRAESRLELFYISTGVEDYYTAVIWPGCEHPFLKETDDFNVKDKQQISFLTFILSRQVMISVPHLNEIKTVNL